MIDTADDSTAAALVEFLRSEGAESLAHAGGCTLLDHLVGTYAITRRWGQPPWLAHAALIHSVYGTDSYERRLLHPGDRARLAAIAGEDAERLAYLFCVTPRRPLLAGTHRWARNLPSRAPGGQPAGSADAAARDELDALVLLHMANLADQARDVDGSPGRWLVALRDFAELLVDAETLCLPPLIAQLATLSDSQEASARAAYRQAVREEHEEARRDGFSLAAAGCPVVAEPCVWLSYLAQRRGDAGSASAWATQARTRLAALGTAWDKRLDFEQWLAIIDGLEGSPDLELAPPAGAVTDPRALLEVVLGPIAGVSAGAGEPGGTASPGVAGATVHSGGAGLTTSAGAAGSGEPVAPDPAAGRRRFQRYVEALARGGDGNDGAVYPELEARAWHDPSAFAIVGYLEANYPAIRDEILGLEATQFHRESERIRRTGAWDVAFLYERGRRHDDVCDACPVTTHAVEAFPTLRSAAGLIYASRMRPMTDISPHRGPTNLRLRCHLAIKVPTGDCAIRVGGEARRWQEGQCLVFDDFLVHEAWNHTDEDRIVLIVDLWHPGLSQTEVMLLEALHNHTYRQAQRLSRYWSGNAAAASEAQARSTP